MINSTLSFFFRNKPNTHKTQIPLFFPSQWVRTEPRFSLGSFLLKVNGMLKPKGSKAMIKKISMIPY